MPVLSATSERSFSAMRCVDSFLRSTIADERLMTYDLCIYMYTDICQVALDMIIDDFVRDRPFNLKGGRGLWFFVSFIIFFSDNTRVRIFIYFVGQS
jgi:hypothetical protein